MERVHVFLLNPAAGHSDQTHALSVQIGALCREKNLNYEILYSEYKGHIAKLVTDYALRHASMLCRFYACGGDGTLNEVVTGALDCDNAEVACYACGTGNDFIKIFDDPAAFRDLSRIVDGQAHPFDAMTVEGGGERFGAINICSAGVDARVADWVGKNKRRFAFGGKLIYDLSLAKVFFSALSRRYKVKIDGASFDGEYAILVAASGRYYGGGYYAVPEAEPDDGELDFLLVKKVSHLGLISLIGKYQSGRHGEFAEKTVFMRGHTLELETEKPEPVNFDGEIFSPRKVRISLSPDKIAFVLPKGCHILRTGNAEQSKKEENRVNSSKPG